MTFTLTLSVHLKKATVCSSERAGPNYENTYCLDPEDYKLIRRTFLIHGTGKLNKPRRVFTNKASQAAPSTYVPIQWFTKFLFDCNISILHAGNHGKTTGTENWTLFIEPIRQKRTRAWRLGKNTHVEES